MTTIKAKFILASWAVPFHGTVEIELNNRVAVVKGDYHPDDSKVIHFCGSTRQAWYAARTVVRGYGRSRLQLSKQSRY